METAAAAYEGGAGGKFRRRPFRRPAATPYDRPQAAVRGLRPHPAEEGRNGWLSKLVDPASRIITRNASRFFSSVFRKRLGSPPETSEANLECRQDNPEVVCINPLSEVQEQRDKDGENLRNNSGDDGITEVEQLLKQKTFTRVEFDRLTELLRSRTVDLSAENEKRKTDLTKSIPVSSEKKENANVSGHEDAMGSYNFFASTPTPRVNLNVPEEEAPSPVELAKAYVGSRPSKVSPTTIGLRSQALRDATTLPSTGPFPPKPFHASIAPRSIVPFSGISASEIGYQTPRPHGRSAIFKMSRSPYFKGPPAVNLKGAGTIGDAYAGPSTSSQWTPTDVALSGGKQVLKRRSSVLESDLGSVGPIRRIRQKSNLISPLKDINRSVPGKILSTPSTPNYFDVVQGSTSSMQKPVMLNGVKYASSNLQDAETGGESSSRGTFATVPPKSTEMARKIFQQIDKLVPSPKEKSSEPKASKDELPTKLTLNMLHGRALRSTEDVDSYKIDNVATNVTDNGILDSPHDTHLKSLIKNISHKQDRVVENGLLKKAISGVKLASSVSVMENTVISIADTKPVMLAADFHVSSSSAIPAKNKPAFQMQAPEDLFELDDDSYGSRDATSPSATGKEKLRSAIPELKVVNSETTVPEMPLVSSSNGNPASGSTLTEDGHIRGPDKSVIAEKDAGFTFPVVPSPSILPQPPSTPTMPTPLIDKSAPSEEQIATPMYNFGSKSPPTLTFSSTSTSFSNHSGTKVGVKSDSKLEVLESATTTMTPTVMTPTPAVETQSSDKGDKKTEESNFKSFGNAVSSTTSMATTPGIFSFVSSSPSLNNGFVGSTMPTFSVSATPTGELSSNSVNPGVFNTGTTSGNGDTSCSDSPPTFPVLPSFQFGSSTSAVATDSVPPTVMKSETKGPEIKQVKEPSFGTASFSSPASSGIFVFGASVPSSATFGSTSGSLFGTQTTQPGSGVSSLSHSSTNLLSSSSSSPTSGLGGSSLFSFSSSAFGLSSTSNKQLGSSSGFGISSAMPSNPSSSSSFAPLASAASIFNSSSQPATQSVFSSGFGSSLSSPSTGFTFGLMPASSGSATLSFGSSSGPAFSFTSSASAPSAAPASPAQSAFGIPTSAVGFGSGSPGNDQMSVEDSMADDPVQTGMPMVPAFGQPANAPLPSTFVFGSPAVSLGGAPGFQYASPQASAFPQSQSSFQASGSLGIAPGGNFSLGSGGGDKASRRVIKVKRKELRKK